MSMDAFKPTPKTVSVQVDSIPPGADATSSLGPSCKTPCSLAVPDNAESFSVAFALPNYQPLTVPVQVTRHSGDYITSQPSITFDPNPVVGELQAEAPKRPARRKPRKRAAAKPAAAAPVAAAAAGNSQVFPAPTTAQPAR
ncbi:MAG TPA: hypothetical protein VN130_05215 [Xanthobacteraceae bacterium]|nr:hypothetical protein [Xanthobacteraceae bacterium]